jgi:choline dehydrogenase-like flavoprotein
MKSVVVVGSGASGVQFALSVLRKGYQVLLLDVGYRGREPVNPEHHLETLKESLDDPVGYFLGRRFESVIFPGHNAENYGFPPSKDFVFTRPPSFDSRGSGFAPLFSFARGGLAEAWTGGSYPFNDHELEAFPFSYADLQPHYAEVARRTGVNGSGDDDLARFFPVPGDLLEPLRLDEHSALLMSRYSERRTDLNRRLGCYLGRSRLAVLSQDRDGRGGCTYLGRCLWGCPRGALYTPSLTLRECLRHPNFRYLPNTYVRHFETDSGRRVSRVACESVETGERFTVPAEVLVLAAGTLMTAKIFLTSLWRATGRLVRLEGLMDNRQIMMPYVNLRMVGRRYDPENYQYHQVAMGLEGDHPRDYVHCQITTLKTALFHPIIQRSPFDLRTALLLFRQLHAALGLINVNLHDTPRKTNFVTVEPRPEPGRARLVVEYAPPPEERQRVRQVLRRVRQSLWALGCVVPPGMTHVRPMGASVHYAGTIPMSAAPRPLTASPECRSHDFDNLFFVDGTTFPFLPAKNLTYTLMANAVRVAEQSF